MLLVLCRLFRPVWTAIALASLMGGCRPNPRPAEGDSSPPLPEHPAAPHQHPASLDYLLASAGRDFRENSPGLVQVRSVRYGLRDTTGGVESYVLCGEFRLRSGGDTVTWAPFATVETSKYEQWLGDTRFCHTLSGSWDSADSLTARLQKALE